MFQVLLHTIFSGISCHFWSFRIIFCPLLFHLPYHFEKLNSALCSHFMMNTGNVLLQGVRTDGGLPALMDLKKTIALWRHLVYYHRCNQNTGELVRQAERKPYRFDP